MSISEGTAGKRNGQAVAYMLLSVAGFSLIPLIISQGAAENPFMFNAGWRLGFGAGLLSFLLARYWPLTTDSEVWTLIGKRIFRWA